MAALENHGIYAVTAPLETLDNKQLKMLFSESGGEKISDVWLRRLTMFREVQHQYYQSKRIKNLLAVISLGSVALMGFSFLNQQSLSDLQFWTMLAIISLSVAIYPISFIRTLSYSRKRLVLSRFFYNSNHEVDIANGSLSLIDRGSNKVVAEIPI